MDLTVDLQEGLHGPVLAKAAIFPAIEEGRL
jgi:hypothetical protein